MNVNSIGRITLTDFCGVSAEMDWILAHSR